MDIIRKLTQRRLTNTRKPTGSLTMNNITHPVTFALMGRYDGSELEAVGSASILVSDWGIQSPFAIRNDPELELLVILQRR